MFILGIETSCDETSIALLEAKKEKAYFFIKPIVSTVASQIRVHAPYGGVVPLLASREHVKNLPIVLQKVSQELFSSKKNIHQLLEKIDLVAVTKGPGLMPALLVGVNFAKTLAWALKKPIIGVNHLEGHLLSFLLPEKSNCCQYKISDLRKIFPALALIVSGGHTQLIYAKNIGRYEVIGETLDDAAGECFDKGARILGLGYPGGPVIAAEAAKYKLQTTKYLPAQIDKIQKLPRPMVNSQNYDFSFSGLKTALLYAWRKLKTQEKKKLLAYFALELEDAITDVLVFKTIKAARDFQVKSIILGGGVTANQKLRTKLEQVINQQKNTFNFYSPLLQYTTDNAMMICLGAFFNTLNKKINYKTYHWQNLDADANWRL